VTNPIPDPDLLTLNILSDKMKLATTNVAEFMEKVQSPVPALEQVESVQPVKIVPAVGTTCNVTGFPFK